MALSEKETLPGEGVPFERTRRITGYLSLYERWNNAKKQELKDRVKHCVSRETEMGGVENE